MVAACEVRLLFIWLYESPGHTYISSAITGRGRGEEGLTVERDPSKARASPKATSDLVDPRIVELHPARLVGAEVAGLDVFPEALALEVLARLHGVDGPFPLYGEPQELDGADENGAGRRVDVVLVAAEPEDDGAEAEHDCR
jgi:hypothetical protein